MAAEAERLFKDCDRPILLTVVPQNGILKWPPTGGFELRSFSKRGREKISSCLTGPMHFLGEVDFSLNLEPSGFKCLSAHFHCITSRPLSSVELKRLKAKFRRDPSKHIYFPVKEKPIREGDLRSVGEYCCKTFYTKRSSFIAQPQNSNRNPYRDGEDQSLSAKEDAMLRLFLSENEVCDPFLSGGLKRVRTSDPAEVRLMLTTKK
ncbi:hypothetical protein JQX03_24875 [Sulfitobacter pseudonitzschiae]|nr:hypothetical protein [Pseudosulfitobacter pseudonitzschiae]